jgi:hypothetical protein
MCQVAKEGREGKIQKDNHFEIVNNLYPINHTGNMGNFRRYSGSFKGKLNVSSTQLVAVVESNAPSKEHPELLRTIPHPSFGDAGYDAHIIIMFDKPVVNVPVKPGRRHIVCQSRIKVSRHGSRYYNQIFPCHCSRCSASTSCKYCYHKYSYNQAGRHH